MTRRTPKHKSPLDNIETLIHGSERQFNSIHNNYMESSVNNRSNYKERNQRERIDSNSIFHNEMNDSTKEEIIGIEMEKINNNYIDEYGYPEYQKDDDEYDSGNYDNDDHYDDEMSSLMSIRADSQRIRNWERPFSLQIVLGGTEYEFSFLSCANRIDFSPLLRVVVVLVAFALVSISMGAFDDIQNAIPLQNLNFPVPPLSSPSIWTPTPPSLLSSPMTSLLNENHQNLPVMNTMNSKTYYVMPPTLNIFNGSTSLQTLQQPPQQPKQVKSRDEGIPSVQEVSGLSPKRDQPIAKLKMQHDVKNQQNFPNSIETKQDPGKYPEQKMQQLSNQHKEEEISKQKPLPDIPSPSKKETHFFMGEKTASGSGSYSNSWEMTTPPLPVLIDRTLSEVSTPFNPSNEVPLYWHIPRTGGTTVKTVLGTCLGLVMASEVGSINMSEEELTVFSSDRPRGSFVNVDTTSIDGIQRAKSLGLVESHMAQVIATRHFVEATTLFSEEDQAKIFTMFRNPIERAVSLFYYNHHRSDNESSQAEGVALYDTVEEYANSPHVESNWMIRHLTGKKTAVEIGLPDLQYCQSLLKHKFLIGLYEERDTSFERFFNYFGWSPRGSDARNCVENVILQEPPIGKSGEHEALEENSPGWKRLESINGWDLKLYKFARDLFLEQEKFISS